MSRKPTRRKNTQNSWSEEPFAIMRHYVTLTPDGLYHVQNMVGPYPGQHHIHTEQGYRRWKSNIDKKYIHLEKGEFCVCGLEPGYVKEYDGRIWFNNKYK